MNTIFRLDFTEFDIKGPEPVNNVCTQDQFMVSGGSPTPAVCGKNNGNHSKQIYPFLFIWKMQ